MKKILVLSLLAYTSATCSMETQEEKKGKHSWIPKILRTDKEKKNDAIKEEVGFDTNAFWNEYLENPTVYLGEFMSAVIKDLCELTLEMRLAKEELAQLKQSTKNTVVSSEENASFPAPNNKELVQDKALYRSSSLEQDKNIVPALEQKRRIFGNQRAHSEKKVSEIFHKKESGKKADLPKVTELNEESILEISKEVYHRAMPLLILSFAKHIEDQFLELKEDKAQRVQQLESFNTQLESLNSSMAYMKRALLNLQSQIESLEKNSAQG